MPNTTITKTAIATRWKTVSGRAWGSKRSTKASSVPPELHSVVSSKYWNATLFKFITSPMKRKLFFESLGNAQEWAKGNFMIPSHALRVSNWAISNYTQFEPEKLVDVLGFLPPYVTKPTGCHSYADQMAFCIPKIKHRGLRWPDKMLSSQGLQSPPKQKPCDLTVSILNNICQVNIYIHQSPPLQPPPLLFPLFSGIHNNKTKKHKSIPLKTLTRQGPKSSICSYPGP